ncbi:hypothetical protein SY83_01980 [Paenibacillus swuensis]|uniref:AraC family transcriptional regulator n=1 Tax=Paenibacillus swuensis TaxID=1178515 RepID=A0A172TET8_9BACL|nr:helix-turn-helix domain-containing protein [Paenibacillus swuensis]ANE45303.1 hypothetical protein SY83_01980 [Paenibacillus swuensis]
MNVLIVDDEIYAVKGLRSGVRWDVIGVNQVFEAYHTAMAQDVLTQDPVDIMICDIEMPGGSGLDLMAWVDAQGLALETIVLTCHSEFSYAQKALQLGGCDYMLKPVVYTELEMALMKAMEKAEERKRMSQSDEEYREIAERWNSHKPLLIERFWQDVLERRTARNMEAMKDSLLRYGITLDVNLISKVRLVFISVEGWEKPLNDWDEDILEFAVLKAAEEMILEQMPGHAVKDPRGNVMLILYAGECEPESVLTEQLCSEWIAACKAYFYCKVSCYVGNTVPLAEILTSYLGLRDMEYRNVTRTNEVIFYETGAPVTSEEVESGGHHKQLEWADLVEEGDVHAIMHQLDVKLSEGDGQRMTVETLTMLYHALLQAVYYVLQRKGFSAQLLYEKGMSSDPHAVTRSVPQFKRWAEEFIQAASSLWSAPVPAESPVVLKLKAYIAAHLSEELSREELAAHVYLNPAYLSRLFRKETGEVLTDYILQQKMHRAASLLTETDQSISEVAAALGYGNFSYFARLFRKVYGHNPHDYRKARRKRGLQ